MVGGEVDAGPGPVFGDVDDIGAIAFLFDRSAGPFGAVDLWHDVEVVSGGES